MASSRADGDTTTRLLPPGELDPPLSWAVVLTPHVVHPDVDIPADAVQVHVLMRFDRPSPPAEPLRLERWEAWRSTQPGRVEVGITVRALDAGGDELARALWVCRGTAGATGGATPGLPADHGTRRLARAPTVAAGELVAPVACPRVGEGDIRRYARQTGVRHALHSDVDHCRALGYDGLVVQGVLFVDAVAQAAELAAGEVAIWFLSPSTSAARCTLHATGDTWLVRDGATTVAVASVSPYVATATT